MPGTLARAGGLGRLTATIELLPSAAPALVAVGDELDARLVATIQYGRVLLVVASVLLLALIVGGRAEARASRGWTSGAARARAWPATPRRRSPWRRSPLSERLAALPRMPAVSLVEPLALAALVTAPGMLEECPTGTDAPTAISQRRRGYLLRPRRRRRLRQQRRPDAGDRRGDPASARPCARRSVRRACCDIAG